MNRSAYFNYCEEKLSLLCLRIETRGQLNILDFHLHSEDFYLNFFNLLYDYSLQNMNALNQNAEALDLIDTKNKIVVQISATATKVKIESALGKNLAAYKGNTFKFISISKDASSLKKLSYVNPHSLAFSPAADIYDVPTIVGHILHLDIVKQKHVHDLLKLELQSEVDDNKVETNLASVIGILAKEDLANGYPNNTIPFNIDDKILANNLNAAAYVVEDYKIHHSRIDKIYSEFDKLGVNKSKSVLDALRLDYIRLMTKHSGDELFFQVVDSAVNKIKASANYIPIPADELLVCVSALAVDAFIRCKIFKNPAASHAVT